MPSHFITESIGQRAMLFEISREIVDLIVGKMFYSPDDGNEREDLSHWRWRSRFQGGWDFWCDLETVEAISEGERESAVDFPIEWTWRLSMGDDVHRNHSQDQVKCIQYDCSLRVLWHVLPNFNENCWEDPWSFRKPIDSLVPAFHGFHLRPSRLCSQSRANIQAVAGILYVFTWSGLCNSSEHVLYVHTSPCIFRVTVWYRERSCFRPAESRVLSCRAMFEMMNKVLHVLCKYWIINLLGIYSDGAINMTGRNSGVVTHIESAMEESWDLIRIWCVAH